MKFLFKITGFTFFVTFLIFVCSTSLSAQLNLEYSTYLGGSDMDWGYSISVGTDGTAYVTGQTDSKDFPTENPYQAASGGNREVFVSALYSSGSVLYYSTYLGGSGTDVGLGIIVGTEGRAYVTGDTLSSDFPTENPYQASWAEATNEYGVSVSDAFVSTFSITGSALFYSTYLGGRGNDDGSGNGISLGTDGKVYITGSTDSSDFPTQNPYQAEFAGGPLDDAFVTALTSAGSALSYSTYLGGSWEDYGYGISVGKDGKVYVAGITSSTNFPLENPYQVWCNSTTDVFISSLTSSGSSLYYSTYLGGGELEYGPIVVSLGTDGKAYIAGRTSSFDFPTKNPYQASGSGIFITSLTSTGSALYYSTYLGEDWDNYGYGISVGTDGRAYITGETKSSDFPIINPYQASYGGGYTDAFVSALSASGSALYYSTFLGGGYGDCGRGISLGTDGKVYVTGYTSSINFPTRNSYQAALSIGNDAFICRFIFVPAPTPAPTPEEYKTPTPTPTLIPTPTVVPPTPTTIPPTPTAIPPTPTSVPPTPTPITSDFLVIDSSDYDGDGTSDIAIFRRSSGMWSVKGVTRAYYGSSSDIPIPGDYDGDSTADIGIFRGNSGLWGVRNVTRIYYGSSSDIPIPSDYNGDGSCEVGIFRSSTGLWAVIGVTRAYFGSSGDLPVPGDYDGDANKDIALFRGSSGLWAIQGLSRVYYGSAGDSVVPGDYNGDGTWEAGIFRASSGMWGIRGVTRVYYGSASDQPVPADYNGDLSDDIGIFRGSSGLWGIRDISRAYFGNLGDIPVTR